MLALIEEIGEIAGWYKKHYCYGKPKEDIKIGLKEEFGDFLYYLVKYADLKNVELTTPSTMLTRVGILEFITDMASSVSLIYWVEEDELTEYLNSVFEELCILINTEGWTLLAIAEANIAKLTLRHGDSYNPTHLESRDKIAEHEIINE